MSKRKPKKEDKDRPELHKILYNCLNWLDEFLGHSHDRQSRDVAYLCIAPLVLNIQQLSLLTRVPENDYEKIKGVLASLLAKATVLQLGKTKRIIGEAYKFFSLTQDERKQFLKSLEKAR